MKLATVVAASSFVIALAGCGARNPVTPVLDTPVGAEAPEEPFVLASALDARLPAPLEEAADAGPADLAIIGAAGSARDERRRASAEPVVFWNQLTATLGRGVPLPPPRFARAYALTHVAIHDALHAGGDRARGGGLSGPALAAGAASTVLAYLFPNAGAQIEAAVQEQLAGQDSRAALRSWRLGVRVGQLVVLYGQNDRSDTPFTGTMPTGPGIWNGTNPVLPMCGEWKTWILRSGDEFQARPPHPYGSPADLAEVAEVLEVARNRTPGQIAAAHYWGDLPPPMIWCNLLNERIASRPLSLRQAARAHAFLNVTMYDAFVSCWSTKYRYWTARPFMRITDPAFTTVIPTPNFPSYSSGHTTISAAAAGVLSEVFPRETRFFRAQAAEAAMSRLWGGIHFRRDNEQGAAVGVRIGEKAVRAMRHGFGPRYMAVRGS